MASSGPANDPASYAAWRSERRRVAKALHPDVGGDPQTYLRTMREVDRRHGISTSQASDPAAARPRQRSLAHRLGRARHTAARRSKRAVQNVRARLPRKVPGSRRYIDL